MADIYRDASWYGLGEELRKGVKGTLTGIGKGVVGAANIANRSLDTSRAAVTNVMESLDRPAKELFPVGSAVVGAASDFGRGVLGVGAPGAPLPSMGNEGRRATYAQMAGTPPVTKPSQAAPVVQKALESSGGFPQGNNPDEAGIRSGVTYGMTSQERNVDDMQRAANRREWEKGNAVAPAAPRRGTYEWAQEIARMGGVDPSNPLPGGGGGGAPMRSYQEQLANVQRMNAMSDLKEAIDRTGTRPGGTIYANPNSIGAMMQQRADRQAKAGHAALLRDYAKLTGEQGVDDQKLALMARELGIKDTASLRDMMSRLGAANIEAGARRDVAGMGLEGTKYGHDVALETGRMSSTAALLGAMAKQQGAGRPGREAFDMARAQTQTDINNINKVLAEGYTTDPQGNKHPLTPQMRSQLITHLSILQKSQPSMFNYPQLLEAD